MVRERVIQTIRYGYFREALEGFSELGRLCGERGLKQPTFWAPSAGVTNELIVETEFEDFGQYERENAAFYSDPAIMKTLRSVVEYIIEGSGRSELIESAPTLA